MNRTAYENVRQTSEQYTQYTYTYISYTLHLLTFSVLAKRLLRLTNFLEPPVHGAWYELNDPPKANRTCSTEWQTSPFGFSKDIVIIMILFNSTNAYYTK